MSNLIVFRRSSRPARGSRERFTRSDVWQYPRSRLAKYFSAGKALTRLQVSFPIRRPPNDFSIVGDGSSNGVHEHDRGLRILEGLPDGLGSIVLISRCGFVSLPLVVGARQLVQMLAEGRSG